MLWPPLEEIAPTALLEIALLVCTDNDTTGLLDPMARLLFELGNGTTNATLLEVEAPIMLAELAELWTGAIGLDDASLPSAACTELEVGGIGDDHKEDSIMAILELLCASQALEEALI